LRIALVTPAGPRLRTGNRHTALRWAAMLRAAGHAVDISVQWPAGKRADAMLALHARRSHASISAFHGRGLLVVALTGTDLYRDLPDSPEARESLELADRLIVLQPEALKALPRRLRVKARVVIQSSMTKLRHSPVGRRFRVCVVGHLRIEKDSLRTLAALALLPHEEIEVVQLGGALDPALAQAARAAMRREARYRWLGEVPHSVALRWMASSHAMVMSSRLEGGANAVCEALRIGLPVLASRIPGNVGLLGPRYAGYFPLEDEQTLARVLRRAALDARFYARLKSQVAALRPIVAPHTEAAALLDAVLNPRGLEPRRRAPPADPRGRSG
jgi:putative glycosyltransferase (TIGR04348 family)